MLVFEKLYVIEYVRSIMEVVSFNFSHSKENQSYHLPLNIVRYIAVTDYKDTTILHSAIS